MFHCRHWFVVLLISALPALAAEIESMVPQGAVTQVRQAKARFSLPMVKFGDPRLPAPFDVQCGEQEGSGRWVDDRNWVFDFKQDLPAAVTCELRLKRGLRALDGSVVKPQPWVFSTGGPEPRQRWPESYQPVAEDQVFLVSFAAAPTAASLAPRVKCVVDGIGEQIPALVLAAAEYERAAVALFGSDKLLWPSNLAAFRCQRPLPNAAQGKLVFEAGLATSNGATTRAPMEYEFQVRPRFTAILTCERLRAKAACLPISPLRVNFEAPVRWSIASKTTLTTLDGKQRWKPEPTDHEPNLVADEGDGKRSKANPDQWVTGIKFAPSFPELGSVKLTFPPELRDESGRPLANASEFPLTIKLDNFPPLAKFAADFGVLERGVGILPVTVRNVGQQPTKEEASAVGKLLDVLKAPIAAKPVEKLSPSTDPKQAMQAPAAKPAGLGLPYRWLNVSDEVEIIKWYKTLQRWPEERQGIDRRGVSRLKSVAAAQTLRLPTPNDDRASEVIGIPLTKPGLNIVEVESHRLGARMMEPPTPMYVASAALVTNLSAHFRQGLDDALVWVTTLDKGWIVSNATVRVLDCSGKLLASGKTDQRGIWQYPHTLPGDRYDCPLYVFARVGDDLTFTISSWRDGIEPWRFGLPTEHEGNRRSAFAAVLDRGLYRAGETASMKLIARERTAEGFGYVTADKLPDQVKISHVGSDESVSVPLTWQGGAALASWKIPADAKLGSYSITVQRSSKPDKKGAKRDAEHLGEAGDLTVAEFRVPLMKAVLKLPSKLIAADKLDAAVQLQYLAGGPAAGEKVKLRSLVQPAEGLMFSDFEDFWFGTGNVAPEVLQGESVSGKPRLNRGAGQEKLLETREATLDKSGGASLPLNGWEASDNLLRIQSELEYADPNGETQTSASSTIIYPAAILAGVKIGELTTDGIKLEVGLANLDGKPQVGRAIKVEAWLRQTLSHRKRLVGGFYSYENETVYRALGEVCKGVSNDRGRLSCVVKAKERGDLILRASSRDDAGRISYANSEAYNPGEGETWWDQNDGDRIDLIADKKRYESGNTASIQVRMPFREATVLVSVERERVLDVMSFTLTAADPVIRLPIKPHYGPNVYVSVLAVRGRVAEPAPTALVDLGKPAYKLGIVKLAVGGKAYGLEVKVSPDKAVYETRAKAKVNIAVKTSDGKPLPKGAEVAIAAVNEGLLQLRPNESWQLLKNMLGERPYGFYTATAQGQVIGRRHFGRKAVPVGGGGGKGSTRELFDTLLLWKGRVALDAQGQASVEVPLNDALTSFRIVAVATAGSDRFGSGEASIRATKDVMLFSGLANTVRQGDAFEAAFTVRNTTPNPVKLSVAASAEGVPALAAQTVELDANAARELVWAVNVPPHASSLNWQVSANNEAGRVFDRLAIKQKVIEAVPVRTLQATLTQLPPDYSLPVERPADAVAGRGDVTVTLMPTLANALGGVQRYFIEYPYSCLEQQTSRAVGLNDAERWREIAGKLPNYLDGEGFAKYWPSMERGSVDLTSYLLSISQAAGFVIPDAPLEKMKTALANYVAGRAGQFENWPGDSTYKAQRRLRAVATLVRYQAARPNQLDGLILEPNRWPTGTLLDWIGILEALPDVPQRADKLKEARQILSARLDLSGTSLMFSSEKDDYWWWMMDAPDGNASRVLLDALAHADSRADLGRMARGLVARQKRGHWNTTVANAWGAVALRQFASKAEAGAPTGVTIAKLGSEQQLDWASKPAGDKLRLPWPDSASTLQLSHKGSGKPWAMIEARAAVPLQAPFTAGYSVQKQWLPVETKGKSAQRGDVWRVRLTIDAQADMSWVAVDDPVPAGASVLGKGLGNESSLLTRTEQGAWQPSFIERGETRFTAYYGWMPKGKHVLEYTVRLNGRGNFKLPATRVEAMYAPERFGELPNAVLKVE